jgi:glycosyltransferase involved in cell wall biosynthesis
VGRLQANKGFVLLVEALGRLHSELPTKWLWVLWGMGPERSRIESRIAALGLGDHVRLTGHIDDMTLHNLYEVANLFVVPTLYEGSSIVTLEAMVHRKPIVASATGGIPDKVIPGMNGYLTRPGDVDDLAGKLITCLRQEPRWGAMGETSLQMVREKFAWPSIARATIDVYERLLTR